MTRMPRGWVEVDIENALAPLEDGRIIHQGWSPQCEAVASDNDDTWGVLKTTAIQAGAFLPEQNKRLPDALEPRPAREVKPGDLLITCAGPRARCGVACLVRETRPRLMLSGKMYRFRVDDRFIDPRYMEAYLLSETAIREIDRMKTGISDSGLNLTHDRFRKLRFPVAPRGEQARIVAALEEQFSRLDAAESWLRRARSRVIQLRRAVYADVDAGRWPLVPLKNLLREPLRNGHSAKASRDGTGIRTLTLTAVTNGDFSDANTKVTTADPVRVRGLWLEPGDLFIERANTPELVGTAALFRGPPNWAIFPDLLIRVRVSEEVLPEFLEHVLLAERTRRYFRGAAQGIAGSMPKIDQRTVETLSVPLPPLDEQRTLVAKVEQEVSRVEAISSGIDGALRRSAALRRSVLECAFSGRLVSQNPADEPASELIRGIAALRAQTPQVSRRRSTVPA